MGLKALCEDIVAKGEVGPEDVLALRREVFGEITVTQNEVEALFVIDEGAQRQSKEWRDVVRWRIASRTFDELGESWTATSEFRVRAR